MCSFGRGYGSWVANAAVLKVSMGAASSTASKVPDIAFAMPVYIIQRFQCSPGVFNALYKALSWLYSQEEGLIEGLQGLR